LRKESIAKRFVNKFLRDRNILTEHGADIETHAKEPLDPELILETIRLGDVKFERLANCSSWRKPLK